MGQKSAAFDQSGAIFAFYDDADSPAPEGVTTLDLSDEEWASAVSGPGYKVIDGKLTPPPPPTAAEILVEEAKSAFADTSSYLWNEYGVVGDQVPAEWSAYVKALRAIANGSHTTSTELPTKPAA